MEEIWKDIKGYEGQYQVSNTGKVRSLQRTLSSGCCGIGRTIKELVLRPYTDHHGYLRLQLSKNSKTKKFLVHRLVAEAFIPNPNGYRCVNHKDETHTNNSVENLEWCTHKYNSNYGTIKERKRAKQLNHPSISKRVEQLDKKGNHIAFFPSVHEAERFYNIKGNDVFQCCRGLRKTAKGFIWKYV